MGAWACGESTNVALDRDAGSEVLDAAPDAGPAQLLDAGFDAASADAAWSDAARADAAPERTLTEILGTLTGVCPALAAALASPQPALFENRIAFVSGETYTRDELSPGAQHMYDTPNSGGSSAESELIAYEVLHFCEGASLYKTETEVVYATQSKKTDLVVDFGPQRIGVSVARAVSYPCGTPLTQEGARELLEGKLTDILLSSASAAPVDRWQKQILHVISASHENTEAVRLAWPTLPVEVRADTIVYVTETAGGAFLYYGAEEPLGETCPMP